MYQITERNRRPRFSSGKRGHYIECQIPKRYSVFAHLIGHGPLLAHLLQLDDELPVVELHEGPPLVGAPLGGGEALDEGVGGAKGAQVPEHQARLGGQGEPARDGRGGGGGGAAEVLEAHAEQLEVLHIGNVKWKKRFSSWTKAGGKR